VTVADIIILKRAGLSPLHVRVVRLSFARRQRAARNMRRAGYPDCAIRCALGLSRERMKALDMASGLWGALAPVIARQLREMA